MDKELLNKICDAWDLGEPHTVVGVTEGVLNENYIVTTSTGTFFIKSVRSKKQPIILDIYEVERYMQEQGIPSVVMMKNKHNAIFLMEGAQMITVYPYIEHLPRTQYSIKDYFSVGEMLGQIHAVDSAGVAQKIHVEVLSIPNPEEIISKLKKYLSTILHKEIKSFEDELFITYVQMKLEGLATCPKPQMVYTSSLIHGDYNINNVLFGADGVVLGVCDWEKAVYGPKMYELIRTIMYGPLQERPGEPVEIESHYLKQIEAILRGYATSYRFSYEEIMHGYDLMVYSYFLSTWMEVLYYDQNNNRANIFLNNQMNQMQIMNTSNLRVKVEELAQEILKVSSEK